VEDENAINEERKIEHVDMIYNYGMQAAKNWMDEVFLHPRAIPIVDVNEIDISCSMFGKKFSAPFYVAGMTGGHPKVKAINEALATACSAANIPMGLGSQRAGIDNEDLVDTYRVARDISSDLFLIGNIGMSQLVKAAEPVAVAEKCVSMIEANALAIHFNKLQELAQPEGDRNFAKILTLLEPITDTIGVPLIVKEVGMGFSRRDFELLAEYGISAIDVGGYGGTNFTQVESEREKLANPTITRTIGSVFKDCGTPTPASVRLGREFADHDIIATGGIRTGLDIVKVLCSGASMAGMAYPFLISSMNDVSEGDTAISRCAKEIETLQAEIKVGMALLNAKVVKDLAFSDVHFSGELSRWLE
jgi:isopentenyl-diphosphate delta-isomerase